MLKRALLLALLSGTLMLNGCAVGQIGQVLGGLFQGLGQGAGPTAAGPLAGPVTAPLPAAPPAVGQQPPTTQEPPLAGPVSGPRGSSAENVLALDATGLLSSGSHSNDGRLTFTQYGGPTDGTPDANTRAGLGNRGNRLRSTSLALSPNLIREHGLKGGEEIYIVTGGRTVFLGHYDDTTGSRSRNNVIDVYDPQDRLGRDNFMRTVASGQWKLQIGQTSA